LIERHGFPASKKITNPFFDRPILYSPYEYPTRHWELDSNGQPTQRIIENRRRAEFITPIPKPKKRRDAADQQHMIFDEGKGLSTRKQQYDPTSIINELRQQVDQWRKLSTNLLQVTPETARLLQHWRHHDFAGIRPFFCQVEAVETAIWLTEVALHSGNTGKRLLDHLVTASKEANPELLRLALKLATGAGKTTVMAMQRQAGCPADGANQCHRRVHNMPCPSGAGSFLGSAVEFFIFTGGSGSSREKWSLTT
jgi:type III restriction enzyme